MTAPTMRTTLLLTEHLGYPPISLVDDIINAVNELMYKCTQAMEKYLLERSSVGGHDYTEEIRVGIAKVETLWEHSVDRSFDKLELYILRNVLQIPQALIENGSFRLRHHDSLVLQNSPGTQEDEMVGKVESKLQELRSKLLQHKKLRDELQNSQKLLWRIQKYKRLVLAMFADESVATNDEQRAIWRSLTPINESLKFVVSQIRGLALESNDKCSPDRIRSLVEPTISAASAKTVLSSRTQYLAQTTRLELQELPTESSKHGNDSEHDLASSTSHSNNDLPVLAPDWSALQRVTDQTSN
ncbi:LAFA_0C09384g1_1 [Lachancea sp. 'fantastica']|nr:LAFA_0C09384g1_1 [Lachancea sp. 'fantastica']